jgi:hypothetical protein
LVQVEEKWYSCLLFATLTHEGQLDGFDSPGAGPMQKSQSDLSRGVERCAEKWNARDAKLESLRG